MATERPINGSASPKSSGTAGLPPRSFLASTPLLDIDINSNPLKNKLIEVNTCLKFNNKTKQEKKSYFEVIYTSIVRIEDGVKEKKDLQKIILCDVPTEIYEKIEKILLNILSDSGYPGIKFDKKINFNKLFTEKFN